MSEEQLKRSDIETPNDFTPDWDGRKLKGEFQAPPEEHRDDRHDEPRVSWLKRGVAALALTSVAAAGSYLALGRSEAPTDQPKQNTQTSAGAKAGEHKPASAEASTAPAKEVGISAEQYTDPTAITRAFYEQDNQWLNSGVTAADMKSDDFWNLGNEGFADKLATPIDEEYTTALLVPDWESNPRLVSFVDDQRIIHRANLQLEIITSVDDETYERTTEVDDVELVSSDDTTMVTQSRWHEQDNRDKNRGGDYSDFDPNQETGGHVITWKLIDGQWKVADLQYNAG